MTHRSIVYRFMALALLVGAFYVLEWMPLRLVQHHAIYWSLQQAGYAPMAIMHEGSPAIGVGEEMYYFTPECTYVDLLFIVIPFLWVVGARFWTNSLRIVGCGLLILAGNLVRSWASVYLNLYGIEWVYSHDIPNYLIFWPTVAFVVLAAFRRDGKRNGDAASCSVCQ